MYAKSETNEAHEVHIFAKPDATIQFVADNHERYIADYRRDNRKTIVILSIGMNDTKAVESPDNYVSTPEAYKESMTAILNGLTSLTDAVVCVGFAAVDESKTSPKFNTITGKNSYFTNERIRKFNTAFKEAASSSTNATYIDLMDVMQDDWLKSHLIADGLHPNDAGHHRIFQAVLPELSRLL